MIDAIDLMILNAQAPVIDAISATLCARWSEASELWFEVKLRGKFVDIARRCGMRAAIEAGEFELAAYFEIGGVDIAEWPEVGSGVWPLYQYLRSERKKHFSSVGGRSPDATGAGLIAELVRLRLFKQALAMIYRQTMEESDLLKWSILLARCYHGLGFHEALVALNTACPRGLLAQDGAAMVRHAEAMSERRDEPMVDLFRLFQRRHHAGPCLTTILESGRG